MMNVSLCLSGPNTATDSQTTPSQPAAKEQCSLLGKSIYFIKGAQTYCILNEVVPGDCQRM